MVVFRFLLLGLIWRNVTCDNFFTSHHLAIELKKRQMTIVGTIRKNRKKIPSVLLDMKWKPQYLTEAVYDHKDRITILSYVPKKRLIRHFALFCPPKRSYRPARSRQNARNYQVHLNQGWRGHTEPNGWHVSVRTKEQTMAPCIVLQHFVCFNAFIIYTKLNTDWNIEKKNFAGGYFCWMSAKLFAKSR